MHTPLCFSLIPYPSLFIAHSSLVKSYSSFRHNLFSPFHFLFVLLSSLSLLHDYHYTISHYSVLTLHSYPLFTFTASFVLLTVCPLFVIHFSLLTPYCSFPIVIFSLLTAPQSSIFTGNSSQLIPTSHSLFFLYSLFARNCSLLTSHHLWRHFIKVCVKIE